MATEPGERFEPAPLADWLRRFDLRHLPDGWLYRADGVLALGTPCLFVPSDLMVEEPDSDEFLAPHGFPHECLDTATIEDVLEVLRRLVATPTDEQMLEAFAYYLEFDAFLPELGAPPPPPIEVIVARLDREFVDSLGAERPGTQCRHTGCEHGAVAYSVLCARHHFESIQRRPWPFD